MAFATLLAEFIQAAGIRKVGPKSRSRRDAHLFQEQLTDLLVTRRLYSSAAWLLVSQAVMALYHTGCSTCAQMQQPSRPPEVAGNLWRYPSVTLVDVVFACAQGDQHDVLLLQAVDPLSNQIYTEQMLPPWPFWRACQHIGVPCLLLLCRANEVSQACRHVILPISPGPYVQHRYTMENHNYMAFTHDGKRCGLLRGQQGDNIQDAEYLAQAAVTYLMDVEGLSGQLPSLTKDSRWPAPPSWVVYGRQKAGLLL